MPATVGLLTGPVGMGKTTVAARVVGLTRAHGLVCGGLLAPAKFNSCGQKVGIWGIDLLTGERRQLAATDRSLGGEMVGPYSFDAAVVDWACTAIARAAGECDLLVVDEIGKLELWHGTGLAPVLPLLSRGVSQRALVLVRDFLLSELQSTLGSIGQIPFRVNQENRAALPSKILAWFLDAQTTEPEGG